MNVKLISSALAAGLLATALGSGAALAEDSCSAPKSEWQPQKALQQKLEGEGYTVKRIKVENGCYEVYAISGQGKRLEAAFDPKTLTQQKAETEG